MHYAIKVEIKNSKSKIYEFPAQKTMYGGKLIAKNDIIYIFDSENEGGVGLFARGIVVSSAPTPKKKGMRRQTPRVSITVKRTSLAKKRLGRQELIPFNNWKDGMPETELNFKYYRQATNKIIGLTETTARFLSQFF